MQVGDQRARQGRAHAGAEAGPRGEAVESGARLDAARPQADAVELLAEGRLQAVEAEDLLSVATRLAGVYDVPHGAAISRPAWDAGDACRHGSSSMGPVVSSRGPRPLDRLD